MEDNLICWHVKGKENFTSNETCQLVTNTSVLIPSHRQQQRRVRSSHTPCNLISAATHCEPSRILLYLNLYLFYSYWAETDVVWASAQGEVRSRAICICTYSCSGKCLKNFRVAVPVWQGLQPWAAGSGEGFTELSTGFTSHIILLKSVYPACVVAMVTGGPVWCQPLWPPI